MSRHHILATAVLFLSACIVDNPYGRGTGASGPGDTGTGDGDGDGDPGGDGDPSGDGDPTGDGDGDGDTKGDGDGDPTGDGDGDPTGDGDGDPTGDGDGDPTGDGDGDGDPGCTRKQWTYNFNADSWSSATLDVVWTGANAPPCEVEVWATTYLEPWDQLLVFSANEKYYRRVNGSWQAPQNIGQRFAAMNDIEIDSVTNVPPYGGATKAGLIFTSLPTAYLYDISANGNVTLTDIVDLDDEPAPGPPQSTSTRRWALVQADGGQINMVADWWVSWQGFDNGKVYRVNGGFVWQNWPENSSPIFAGPGDPDPANVEAAWGDYDLNRAYFIEP